MSARILIVEDELPMRTALEDCLAGEGFRVITAADGERGLERALKEKSDLILLDVMMPRLDGFAVCAELRRLGHAGPVLMLTAKGRVRDRVNGLDAGADDYLVKPFITDELLARGRALLRRVQRPGASVTELTLGETKIDFARQSATRKRKALHFTAKEFAMLRLPAERRVIRCRARNSSTWRGATPPSRPGARWTCTSPRCAASWRRTRRAALD